MQSSSINKTQKCSANKQDNILTLYDHIDNKYNNCKWQSLLIFSNDASAALQIITFGDDNNNNFGSL